MKHISIPAVLVCTSALVGCAAQQGGGAAAPHGSEMVAEADACNGISPTDEDPFVDSHAITSVEPLREQVNLGKISWMQLRGARVSVAATHSMTRQWLAKTALCHFSRHPISSSPISIAVGESTTGFVVALRTEDQLDRAGAERLLHSSEVAWAPTSTRQQAAR